MGGTANDQVRYVPDPLAHDDLGSGETDAAAGTSTFTANPAAVGAPDTAEEELLQGLDTDILASMLDLGTTVNGDEGVGDDEDKSLIAGEDDGAAPSPAQVRQTVIRSPRVFTEG